jgi:hypothetical protein
MTPSKCPLRDCLYAALDVVERHAEFLHLPTVDLDCNRLLLDHLRPGDTRLPEGVFIVPLPPYSPELNPCEQFWDILKDTEGFANGLFDSIDKLRAALLPGLSRFGEDAGKVLPLVGRPWLHAQANDSAKT